MAVFLDGERIQVVEQIGARMGHRTYWVCPGPGYTHSVKYQILEMSRVATQQPFYFLLPHDKVKGHV